MKYYLIAGEASGDLHAANLVRAMKKQDPDLQVRAWGGDRLMAEGAEVVKHYRDLAFMGFAEVVANLRTITDNFRFCKEDILAWKPDALIFVDYPGFNLRMAKWARQQGIRTIYYISPQIWAWKQGRVKAIRRDVDLMLCILPFEPDFYARFGVKAHFVGHPLLDELRDPERNFHVPSLSPDKRPLVALLPGSRKQEITRMLPLMLRVAKQFPNYRFAVAGAPGQEPDFYQPLTEGSGVEVVFGATYGLLKMASAALVASGTATLETALLRTPQAVCYKAGKVSYWIARQVVKVKYISLVNLIMDAPLVRELIQNDFNLKQVEAELRSLLEGSRREELLSGYDRLEERLGGPGASGRAASLISKFMDR